MNKIIYTFCFFLFYLAAQAQHPGSVLLYSDPGKNMPQVTDIQTPQKGRLFNSSDFRYEYDHQTGCVLAHSTGKGKKAIFQVLHPYSGEVIVSFTYKANGRSFSISGPKTAPEVSCTRDSDRKKVITYKGTIKGFEYHAYARPRIEKNKKSRWRNPGPRLEHKPSIWWIGSGR